MPTKQEHDSPITTMKLDQRMQPVEAMSSIKIDRAVPPPTTSKPPKTSKPTAVSDQVRLLVRRKLVLIGIATIVICATLYTFVKWHSDDSAEAAEAALVAMGGTGAPEISVQSSELWLTTRYFKIFCVLSSMVVLLACATSASVILGGKKAVEAERVLQELCRNTKSDASLAIPVAPIARRRCPNSGTFLDYDYLDIDWVPPVGCGATYYHLQWRKQPEQEPTEWASSVASEKIGVPCCTKGSLRTHTPYQFRVRAFSAVSERWGPWSPPSKPETVRPGKGEKIFIIVFLLVCLPVLVLVFFVFLLLDFVRFLDLTPPPPPRPSVDVYIKPKGVAEDDVHMRV